MAKNIGIMDPAYFVGRKEILNWLNTTFSLNLTKIEETASGAVACQILDSCFGDVPMHKVKWGAKSEYEFIQNYKIIQSVFDKRKVEKHVEVEKLVRAKYQDNLEFMQWMKHFYDHHRGADDYDAAARRAKGKGTAPPARRAPRAGGADAGGKRGEGAPRGAAPRGAGPTRGPAAGRRPAPGKAMGAKRATAGDSKRAEELSTQNGELKLHVEALEKERDFYFGKLRDIEILLQAYDGPDKEMTDKIFKILYATDEDFVVDDEGAEVAEGVEA